MKLLNEIIEMISITWIFVIILGEGHTFRSVKLWFSSKLEFQTASVPCSESSWGRLWKLNIFTYCWTAVRHAGFLGISFSLNTTWKSDAWFELVLLSTKKIECETKFVLKDSYMTKIDIPYIDILADSHISYYISYYLCFCVAQFCPYEGSYGKFSFSVFRMVPGFRNESVNLTLVNEGTWVAEYIGIVSLV